MFAESLLTLALNNQPLQLLAMAYTPPIDEKELVRQLQDPKTARQAFDTLLRMYSQPVYWHIRKMVLNHDDANDLVQNVFLKAWNNLHNFRGDARLSTWLFKIAINESINFINKEKARQGLTEADDDSFLMAKLEADPYFDGEELHRQLLEAVARLPEKQRMVFNMRYFDDMKYEQISEVLGTSVGALKANYHHAAKKVTEALLGQT